MMVFSSKSIAFTTDPEKWNLNLNCHFVPRWFWDGVTDRMICPSVSKASKNEKETSWIWKNENDTSSVRDELIAKNGNVTSRRSDRKK